MKRFTSLLLALLLCLSLASPALAAEFNDVKAGDYCYIPVLWAVENGITSGTSKTKFSPNDTCTVGEILTFLWRAEGKPEPERENPFTDVTDKDFFASAARWAHEKGLVSGDMFQADTPCSRSMAVTYMWKAAGSPETGSADFTDVAADAAYAPAVSWAVEKKITSGTSDRDKTFSPDKLCTRGEIVTFLYRYSGSPEVNVPEQPKEDTKTYAAFPSVPDFSAFMGLEPVESRAESGSLAFYYDLEEINVNEKRVKAYKELLERKGIAYIGSQETKYGPVLIFSDNDVAVMFILVGDKFGIIITTIEDILTSTNSDTTYYKECPEVPDFGAMTGLPLQEASEREDGWYYAYNFDDSVTEETLKAYGRALIAAGFEYVGSGSNQLSIFLEFRKGSTTVLFGEFGAATIAVAVYSE